MERAQSMGGKGTEWGKRARCLSYKNELCKVVAFT